MAKDKDEGKSPFEIYEAGDDIDDDPFLVPKEKVTRPLVGSESLNRPLGSDD